MADFGEALKYTLDIETSKFTNDPTDHGGATKYGITLDELQEWHKEKGLPPATIADVQNLTQDKATQIYQEKYWRVLHLDQIADQRVATALFDIGVNDGVGACARFAQRACGLQVDGVLGPHTAQAINGCEPRKFLGNFIAEVQNYYIGCVTHDPTQIKFLKGWLARSQKIILLIA